MKFACRTSKNYHNDETNLYVYEFHNKISKFVNTITKIRRIVKEKISYLQKASFFIVSKVS